MNEDENGEQPEFKTKAEALAFVDRLNNPKPDDEVQGPEPTPALRRVAEVMDRANAKDGSRVCWINPQAYARDALEAGFVVGEVAQVILEYRETGNDDPHSIARAIQDALLGREE